MRLPTATRSSCVGASNAINATLYDKLNFNFIRDIAPVASIVRVPLCHGGESVGSGQDGSRVHCLRQGQSRQDQHGVGRQRNHAACRRRAVQDDGRRRHGSRAVSRRGARAHRSARRAGAGYVRHHVILDRVHQSRQAARAGGDHRDALGGAAGRPDRGRIRAGLRGERLVWRRRAEEHADRRSSTSSTRRSTPASPIPRSRRGLPTLAAPCLRGSPADFGKLIADETEKWGKVVKFAGIKPE